MLSGYNAAGRNPNITRYAIKNPVIRPLIINNVELVLSSCMILLIFSFSLTSKLYSSLFIMLLYNYII